MLILLLLALASLMAPPRSSGSGSLRKCSRTTAPPPPPPPAADEAEDEETPVPKDLSEILPSENDRAIFEAHFVNRTVARTRIVRRATCELLRLRVFNLFQQMGWGFFVSLDILLYPRLVKAFYATLGQRGPTDTYEATVAGQYFQFNENNLNEWFHLPSGGLRLYVSNLWHNGPNFQPIDAVNVICHSPSSVIPTARLHSHMLTPEARIVHNVVTHTILPKSGSRTFVSFSEAFIVFCVITGRSLNLAHIVRNHMMACKNHGTAHLYYPIPISAILLRNGIPSPGEEALREDFEVDEAMLNRMKLVVAEDGTISHRAPPPPPPQPFDAAGPSSSVPQGLDSLDLPFDLPDFGDDVQTDLLKEILATGKRTERLVNRLVANVADLRIKSGLPPFDDDKGGENDDGNEEGGNDGNEEGGNGGNEEGI